MIRVEILMPTGPSSFADFVTAKLVKATLRPDFGPRWYLYGDAYWSPNNPPAIPMLTTLVVEAGYIGKTSVVSREDSARFEYILKTMIMFGAKRGAGKVVETLETQIAGVAEPNLDRTTASSFAQAVTVAIVDTSTSPPAVLGSGVIATDDGIVVTNRHVIEGIVGTDRSVKSPERVGVWYWHEGADGFIRPFILNAKDYSIVTGFMHKDRMIPEEATDVAFIQLGIEGMPSANFLESISSLAPGQELLASGYPNGDRYFIDQHGIRQRMSFVHSGFISSLRTDAGGMIEQIVCDLPVIPGSSGSPVFLAGTGELAGIVSHSLTFGADVIKTTDREEADAPESKTSPMVARVYGPTSLVVPISFIKKALDSLSARSKTLVPNQNWERVRADFDRERGNDQPPLSRSFAFVQITDEP